MQKKQLKFQRRIAKELEMVEEKQKA